MIWFCLLTYVLLSQITMCTLLHKCFTERDDSQHELLSRLDSTQKQRLLMLSWIASIVLGPFLLPCILFDCLFGAAAKARRSEVKFWRDFKRRYRPLILDPVHRYNIDQKLWEHFEHEQPAFDAFDFQVLGEFVLKDEPLKIETRVLLHPTGQCIAEIGQVGDSYYLEITSFLDNGSVVCTSNGNQLAFRELLAKHDYHCFALPDADGLELIEQHEQNLKRCLKSECAGRSIRAIPEDSWKAYFQYNNRRFGQILHTIGEHDDGPDQVEFPPEATGLLNESTNNVETKVVDNRAQPVFLRVYSEPAEGTELSAGESL